MARNGRAREREKELEAKKQVEIAERRRRKETLAFIQHLATTFEEPEIHGLFARTVEVLGLEKAKQCYEETLAIEAAGGEMTLDNERRRTPGGVYFYRVKLLLRAEDRPADIRYLSKWKKPKPPADEADQSGGEASNALAEAPAQ